MKLLDAVIDGLQAKFPPARATLAIIALVTPIVAAGAAVGTAWVAVKFPSLPKFTPAEVTALALGGLTAVVAPAVKLGYRYIDGWQAKEQRDAAAAERAKERDHELELAAVNQGHVTERAQALIDKPLNPGEPLTEGGTP